VSDINHRTIEVGTLRVHVAEAGSGPLVLLLHGFPECWYSWRHQLTALAEAGFHAVAPDQRGYARTGGPKEIDQYTIMHLVGDVVGLISALDEPNAIVVGHDWGAPVAWHTALLRPDLVRGVVGMSVPWRRRSPKPPLVASRQVFGNDFYQLYFQNPGVERDFEADLDRTFRRVLYGLGGEVADPRRFQVPSGERFLESWPHPSPLPPWLIEEDISTYVAEFTGAGFSGPLNWYRNIDRNWELMAPWRDARVTTPALFVAGQKDPVVSWQAPDKLEGGLRNSVPKLTDFRMYPGIGHWIQQEAPEEINSALIEFARSL
jgi:pimeloyl-ACP methyl ester carboxylesterase